MCVIVVTPSLNKSFKFQSDWPYNNSQVYLLNSILEDLKEDEAREFKTKGNDYFFSSVVNYPNNKSLVRQNVYIDKNGKITKTEVVDKDGNAQIVMKFNKIEYHKKFDKNYFELSSLLEMNRKNDSKKSDEVENNNVNENSNNNTNSNSTNNQGTNTTTNENANNQDTTTHNNNTQNNTSDSQNTNNTNQNNNNSISQESTNTETTASINDIVYPMYLPNNTYLTSQEKVSTKDGERLILTFGGDSSFILVEETSTISDDNLVIPVSGEFDFLADVIGVIGTHSLSWHSNGIDYYMASDIIETAELIDIARSISVLPVSK